MVFFCAISCVYHKNIVPLQIGIHKQEYEKDKNITNTLMPLGWSVARVDAIGNDYQRDEGGADGIGLGYVQERVWQF